MSKKSQKSKSTFFLLNTSSWGFFTTATLLELIKLRKPKNLALGGLFYNAAGA